jgi:hypothetical protein
MFTKEKLKVWINDLNDVLWNNKKIKQEQWHNLVDLRQTLEQIYTSMTSDSSI